MLVYGLRHFRSYEKNLPIVICPSCNCQGHTYLIAYTKYLHIMFIPTFPYATKIIQKCTLCLNSIEENKFSKEFKSIFEIEQKNIKIPKFCFIGTILIILFIAYIQFNINIENNKTKVPKITPETEKYVKSSKFI